jgi:hypothetical protein
VGINTFREVVDILDAAVNGPGTEVGPPHHAFWRNTTRDEFVAKKLLGQPTLVLGDGANSNLILSLKGQPPFGSGPDAEFPRMPVGFDAVPDDSIRSIEQWINNGCPDGSDAAETTYQAAEHEAWSAMSLIMVLATPARSGPIPHRRGDEESRGNHPGEQVVRVMTIHPIRRKPHGQHSSASDDHTGTTKAWPPHGDRIEDKRW